MDFKNLEALRRRVLEDPENPEARLRYLQGRARVEGEGVYLETLTDVEGWGTSGDALQDAAISVVASRLQDDFEHIKTETYRCQDRAFRIGNFVHCGSHISLNLLPGHRYLLRSNDEEKPGAKRVAEKFLKPMLMGQFPVTQSQWDRITGEDMSAARDGDLPINYLTWDDVAHGLSKTPELRAPTAWEWTLACFGGGFTDPFWGNGSWEDYCWCYENSDGFSRQDGFSIHRHDGGWNAFGLVDMLGHINEWCGPDLGNLRPQVKGGSWQRELRYCLAKASQPTPYDRRNNNGVRVCASIPGTG